MIIYLDGHTLKYEVENICRMFFPFERVSPAEGAPQGEDRYIHTLLTQTPQGAQLTARVCMDGSITEETALCTETAKAQLEYAFASLLFPMLHQRTGIRPAWGLLTGIRPVKLYREMAGKLGAPKAQQKLEQDWLVLPKKTALLTETEAHESKVLALSRRESFSLYISIPFCPSRCSYCSFVSHSIELARKLLPEYVRLLCEEIAYTADLAARLGLRLETVYMGGGTPTTLSAEDLRQVLGAVVRHFDLSNVREFTVEAGRPDTITEEKLLALRECGVGRVSINPQTLNPQVLAATRRGHTVEQFWETYQLAQRIGFDSINVDLIAGLPLDTPPSFAATVDAITEAQPGNITVHTLAIKRAAELGPEGHLLEQYRGVEHMIDYGYHRLADYGYHPYYLYRQKNTAANLENTGFCLPGKDGLYNVYIMDETHTILAVGAGGVSKLKNPDTERIERVFNYKYPYEYNSGFQEILRRKQAVEEFYTFPL